MDYILYLLKLYCMYACKSVLGDDGPLKITIYHVTWLPSKINLLLLLLLLCSFIMCSNCDIYETNKMYIVENLMWVLFE